MKPFAVPKGCVLSAALLLPCAAITLQSSARALNPIVQTNYTADPAPVVHDGTVYLYTSHDEDVTVNDFFTMNDWRLYTSTDMVNWTDRGTPLSYRDFTWARGDAWAPHVVPRNGKWYFYVPITQNSGSPAIGVAVSDHPEGPFEDPLGRPLVSDGWGDIDPNVFIDDDGQAYLYWGNPDLKYVLLNEDMISYSGNVVHVPMTTESFGARNGDAERPTLYEEGPWFYRRGDLYYLVYPAGGIPEYIAYSTSSSPTGPFTYRGVIMPTEGSSFTNHPGVIDFDGRSYFFYHNGALPGGGGFKRSVCVEEFRYEADGTFPTIRMTQEGAPQVRPLDPYVQVEAETIAWGEGVETEACSEGGMNVSQIESGDGIEVRGVDFGTGALSFEVRAASATNGGNVEVHLDSASGPLLASCAVEGTGGWQEWVTISCPVSEVTGVHDLHLVFTGGGGTLFNLNWWRFTPIDPPADTDVTDDEAADSGTDPAGDDASASDEDLASDPEEPLSGEPTPEAGDDPASPDPDPGAPVDDTGSAPDPMMGAGEPSGGITNGAAGAGTPSGSGDGSGGASATPAPTTATGGTPVAAGAATSGEGAAVAGTAPTPTGEQVPPAAVETSARDASGSCAFPGSAPLRTPFVAGCLILGGLLHQRRRRATTLRAS